MGCRPRRVAPCESRSHRGISWRLWAAIASCVCTVVACFGISKLHFNDDVRALLRSVDAGAAAADFERIDEITARFGAADSSCIIRAKAQVGDLFSPGSMLSLQTLTDRLATVHGVLEVRSIFDIRREGIAGAVLPVIPRTADPLSEEKLAEVRSRAVRHPLIGGHLLNKDASSSLIMLQLAHGFDAPPAVSSVITNIEDILNYFRSTQPQLSFQLTGLPVLRQQAAQALRRDMLLFNSLGLSLAVILSATIARSLRSTVVACVPPFIGAVWAMGILGLTGMPINILTCVVPSLALVVGTCDSIHFIEDMRRSIRRGLSPRDASLSALMKVGTACGITSLVTAVGFLSLAAARIEAVRNFGLAAAAGAIASFTAVSLLTPLIASTRLFEGLRLGKSSRLASRIAIVLTSFSVRHARPIALIGTVATVIFGMIGTYVDADNRVIDALPRNASASQALAQVDAEFGGAMGVDVVVHWPEATSWKDQEVIDALDEVHTVLAEAGDINRAISYATVAGSLPPRARQRLKATSVNDIVDPENRTAIVRARVADLGSRALEDAYTRIETELSTLTSEHSGWQFNLAGMSVVSARNIRQLVRDLGASLFLEVVVIGGIMALAFRSLLTGTVSMLPNVFPLSVIATAVVLSNKSLDPATVIVFNVCLGLAVDDTVHILSALKRNQRNGLSLKTAMQRAIVETGNAVVIGGVVLCVGFAAVTASSIPLLAGFGRLACVAVLAATIAELILLPAIVIVTDEIRQRFEIGMKGLAHQSLSNANKAHSASNLRST